MIEVKGIKKIYGKGENLNEVLKGVSLTVADGSCSVILGASGSGKSTLLNVVSGLESPSEGQICYDGTDISSYNEKQLTEFRKTKVGFIFQQYYLLPNLTVDKNVKMGADLAGNKNYVEIIEAVGLGEKRNKYPSVLSGGEQQRVAIARALAKKPEVLFLDEPTGALDEKTGRNILDYILKLQKQLGFTMVMVTHNQNIAQTANTVFKMNSGLIEKVYTNENVKSAYDIEW